MAAGTDPPDLYLWLNDDAMLDLDALALLLAERRALEAEGVRDPVLSGPQRHAMGYPQYSGRMIVKRRPWMTHRFVSPIGAPERVDLIAGNCILVSPAVLAAAHPFDGMFLHGWLDWHFAMKVNESGGTTWIASRSVGICHFGLPTWIDPEVPLSKAVRSFIDRIRNGVVILPPIRFYRRYAGFGWPVNILLLVDNRVRRGLLPRLRGLARQRLRPSA